MPKLSGRSKSVKKDTAIVSPILEDSLDTRVAIIQALIPLGLEAVADALQREGKQWVGPRYTRKQDGQSLGQAKPVGVSGRSEAGRLSAQGARWEKRYRGRSIYPQDPPAAPGSGRGSAPARFAWPVHAQLPSVCRSRARGVRLVLFFGIPPFHPGHPGQARKLPAAVAARIGSSGPVHRW